MVSTKKSGGRIAFVAAVLALALAPAALAAKGPSGGGGSRSGGGGGGSSSVTGPVMVADLNGNGLANYGDTITFNVSTSAAQPYVTLNCYQNGVGVSTDTKGFYPGYPWGQAFALDGAGWTSGAADCTASLWVSSSNGKSTTLATTSFHVYA